MWSLRLGMTGDKIMKKVTQNINLRVGSRDEKREEIKAYFNATWTLYEKLFETLAADDVFFKRPQPLRHPIIFYFGHTATFFVNKLVLAKLLPHRIDSQMESTFAIGVDEMSWDDLNDDHYDWPSVRDVRAYRNKVRAAVNQLIDTVDFQMPIEWSSNMWPIMMGIEHERIHLETSSVLIRQLPLADVVDHPWFDPCDESGPAPQNEMVKIAGKRVVLGKKEDHPLYGWDLEYGQATVETRDFEVSKYLVSNGEYLQFVEAGGYEEDRWWTEEGLGWKKYHNKKLPEFWRKSSNGIVLRLMTREILLPKNWPVEVCYLEAKAFCNWLSHQQKKPIRMPDEAEYRRLLQDCDLEKEHVDSAISANWNLEHFASSCPVDMFQHGHLYDVVGNVWQWNETPIYGFDGFEVHPLYDDFATPTFDNRHNLLKGGSWISTGNEIALHSRYAFRRHFYQHAGFRYVATDREVKTEFDVYETDELVAMYLEFQYGASYFNVPNFSKAIATIALQAMEGKPKRRALDLGCAVGRCAFEISQQFDAVDGLDFSARFIKQAIQILENGGTRYEIPTEGELVEYRDCRLEALGLSTEKKNISFMQQDACNLKSQYSGYDLVIAANLIDRLVEPGKFLNDIAHRINGGGILVIASPYTWLETFTKKENWLGGYKEDGEPVKTLDGLRRALESNFVLKGAPQEVPFVIRETARKHQHTVSEVTIWEKK